MQSRTPTRLNDGEGWHRRGMKPTAAAGSAGVMGTARGEGPLRNVGNLSGRGVATLDGASSAGLGESRRGP